MLRRSAVVTLIAPLIFGFFGSRAFGQDHAGTAISERLLVEFRPVGIPGSLRLLVKPVPYPARVDSAAGQAPDLSAPNELRWKSKEPAIIVAGVLLVGLSFIPHVNTKCPCDPAGINSFDRPFAGRHSSTARKLSDVFQWSTVGGSLVTSWLTNRQAEGSAIRTDLTILGETLLLNQGATTLTKSLVGRPRPFIYGMKTGSELADRDTYASFYSGHTSNTFAVATALGKLYARRHPTRRKAWIYGIPLALAGATGGLRIAAGKHFPTDVLVGALAGTAFGFIVPDLHH